ncbi:MAG TPA: preprotein translocase subunit SecG [Chitinophagales bacterium]|nr:preprotein translocase subunit SecG [Chitinophagales bacterium]HRG86915.1 preprotein translocase subunit SecG [Chitinophagales bacterium]HRH53068.1 preprotein translocase subunit SecG [Chitinophagales bacterium]
MLFTIIIIIAIIAAVLLGLVVLIQNPKGGGLSGTFGGAANQIFGYKRTTDDIERITWGLVIIVFTLCLSAAALKPTETVTNQGGIKPEANRPASTVGTIPQAEDPAAQPIDGGEQPADGEAE